VIRTIASRVTGTAISTGRFAVGIPLGLARNVVGHLPFVGGKGDAADTGGTSAESTTAGDAVREREPQTSVDELATAESEPAAAPPVERPRASATAGTPKAGQTQHDEDTPDVVLAVDTPPEVIEPPVDVVGEALAAAQAEEAQKPPQPQPVHVNDDNPVVYSTTSDD
jgi:hypothetical protein